MDKLIASIDQQIAFNQGKNIFRDQLNTFQFATETIQAISSIDQLNTGAKQLLIDYATDKAMEEFCRINQYYSFDGTATNKLRTIYADLFETIQAKKKSVAEIAKTHYENLRQWIKESNPFAEKIYKNEEEVVKPVACSEYSPDLQIKLLNIKLEQIMEPVLDIGCGRNGSLVHYLIDKGIDAFGLDRFSFEDANFETADWLEYHYGTNKWGTIISHLGFSNHFHHHHLRADGKYLEYAQTYMSILQALKTGGVFHYAPDLPFIEKYLDDSLFAIQKQDISSSDFKTTLVTRLK